MIVAIHQPEHLVWPGFLSKVACADLLLLLDDVQYRSRHVHNRNRIVRLDGVVQWVVAPVSTTGGSRVPIGEVRLDDDQRWREVYTRTLTMNYARHPHFRDHAGGIIGALVAPHTRLLDLNLHLLRVMFDAFGVSTPQRLASEFDVHTTKSERLRDLCLAVGADTYLAGAGSSAYLDVSVLESAEVGVMHHAYVQPRYAQRGQTSFVSNLSALDMLFNVGSDALELVRVGTAVAPVAGQSADA